MASDVKGWFADVLDINSPSRVFAQLGGDTVDGLNAGLDAQRVEPARRVGEIARRVRQAGAGLAIGAASLPAVADVPIDTAARRFRPPAVVATCTSPSRAASTCTPPRAWTSSRWPGWSMPGSARPWKTTAATTPPVGGARSMTWIAPLPTLVCFLCKQSKSPNK